MTKKTNKIDIFKYAAKNTLRFPFKGSITVEDLFKLRMEDLDIVYKTLNVLYKQETNDSDSLMNNKREESSTAERLRISIDIVKEIFEDKRTEAEEILKKREKEIKMQKILEAIDRKENDALSDKSIDELKAELDSLSEG